MIIEPGTEILNYKITKVVGHGGMGRVYKAIHLSLDRTVAVKVVHPRFLSNEKIVERFYHEARIQAGLDHPNIVRVYDFFEQENNCFIVMEFVEGESVSKIITHQGAFEPKLGLAIFRKILDGISYAHTRGVIHKDIKTSNFLLTPKNVKITDFGIAQIIDDSTAGLMRGDIMGTPEYMSPEMLTGRGSIDQRTDVYSLGIALYEMLTGKLPFTAGNASGNTLISELIEKEPVPPRELNPGITEIIQIIIQKAMAKEPDKRYQSVDELIKAIDNISFSRSYHLLNRLLGVIKKNDPDDSYRKSGSLKSDRAVNTSTGPDITGDKGSLEETGFPELLSSLHHSKSSGCLHIKSDSDIRIYFSEGFVVFVDYREPDLLLGNLLVNSKQITEEDRQAVIEFSRMYGVRTGEALIKLGKLSHHDLSYILENQLKLKIIRGLRLKEGSYRFDHNTKFESGPLFRIDPLQIIYDSVAGNTSVTEKELDSYDPGDTIRLSADLKSKINNIVLSSARQYRFIKSLEDLATVDQVISKSPLDRYNTLKLLRFLLISKLISMEKTPVSDNRYVNADNETVLLKNDEIKNELKKYKQGD